MLAHDFIAVRMPTCTSSSVNHSPASGSASSKRTTCFVNVLEDYQAQPISSQAIYLPRLRFWRDFSCGNRARRQSSDQAEHKQTLRGSCVFLLKLLVRHEPSEPSWRAHSHANILGSLWSVYSQTCHRSFQLLLPGFCAYLSSHNAEKSQMWIYSIIKRLDNYSLYSCDPSHFVWAGIQHGLWRM